MDELTGNDNTRLTGIGDGRRDFSRPKGSLPGTLEEKLLAESLDAKAWLTEATSQRRRTALVRTLHRDARKSKFDDSGSQVPASSVLKRITSKLTGKRSFDIVDVNCSCPLDDQNFWGGWIDGPQIGDRFIGVSLHLYGWVIGREEKVSTVQIFINEEFVTEAVVNVPRPDVARAHLFSEENCPFGFSATLDLSDLPHELMIELRAVFTKQDEIVPIGGIALYKY